MYLRATQYLPLNLETDVSGQVEFLINVSFCTQHDMKIHTGVIIALENVLSMQPKKTNDQY